MAAARQAVSMDCYYSYQGKLHLLSAREFSSNEAFLFPKKYI